MIPVQVYLALGSNLGDRQRQLGQALSLLQDDALQLARRSALYETAPQGPLRDQPLFLNAAACFDCRLEPRQLLARCQQVERALGRKPATLKGPRAIDLDILLYGDRQEIWPELVIPHPELTRRAFVLVPLLEIAPKLVDPRDGNPLSRQLPQLRDRQEVHRWSGTWC